MIYLASAILLQLLLQLVLGLWLLLLLHLSFYLGLCHFASDCPSASVFLSPYFLYG